MLPMEWILLLAGLAVGALFAWMAAGRRTAIERQRADGLAAELAEKARDLDSERRRANEAERAEAALKGEKSALDEARRSLETTFVSLAANALKDNNNSFLLLAKHELEKQQSETSNQLDAKEKAIQTLLDPISKALKELQETTHGLEVKREGAYQAVLGVVQGVAEASDRLGAGTRQLVEALRKPQVRGNWGQEQLERCIEFAGMVEHVSFDKEVAVRDGDTSLRPDCVVHLPNQRTIVIDVKTPLEALLSAANCSDESERAPWLLAHARNVKKHLDDLSSKSYWKQFSESPDFVVCFLPSEAAFSAALDQDGSLIEYGSRANVILATPTTLIALLKAVAFGWQQMEITRNAVAIREAGQKLYEKLSTAQEYFMKMGNALVSAVRQYNSMVGCIEGRGSVFSLARKLHDLGIGEDELSETPQLEIAARGLMSDDWQQRGRSFDLAANADNNPDTSLP